MGASDWEYFVKYQPDIEMAFRELQQATFDSGDYYLVKLDLPATVEEYVEQYYSMYPDFLQEMKNGLKVAQHENRLQA